MASIQQRILDIIRRFRNEWRLFSYSERTTVCGVDCMLMALYLSIAEVNKKNHRDFEASLSELILTWNYLVPDKLGILQRNMEAPENYADITSAYAGFLKRCNMMDLIDVCQKCRALENESISCAQLLEFITGTADLAIENQTVLPTPSTPTSRVNQDHEELPLMVKKFFYAYLRILINSKNDLAFACILNVPDRGLGREAFTDLKHAAQQKQIPIFLMARSFIRTIELGGKGYAPSPADPLRTHMKGLSHLVHFIDKLEEIIGEVQDPRLAGGQILSTIKMHLIKGRNSRDAFCQAAEEVVQGLDLRIKNIINIQHESVTASTTGTSPARPKLHAINHGTAYCGKDTVKALLALLDEAATDPPPKSKAQMFGDEFGFPSMLMLFRSPVQSSGSSPKVLRQRIRTAVGEKIKKLKQPLIRSQFSCTYKDDQMTEAKGQHLWAIQAPTCECPVLKEKAIPDSKKDSTAAECLHSQLKIAALGTGPGNVHQNGSKSKEIGKLSCQPRNKSSKRKQVNRTSENVICSNEYESLQHIHSKRHKTAAKCQHSLDSTIKRAGKCNKIAAKNKLIVGQAKLTNFFRL